MSEEKELVITEEVKTVERTKIDVQKALKLKLLGNSYEEIASVLGCSKQGVHAALTKFETFIGGLNQGDLQAYADERRNILNSAELTLLRSVVDEEAIKKAPLAARVMAFGIMFDKGRLERGESTQNLGVLGKILMQSEDELGKAAKDKDAAVLSLPREQDKRKGRRQRKT